MVQRKERRRKDESAELIEMIVSTCGNDLEGECRAGNEDVASMVVVVVSGRGRYFLARESLQCLTVYLRQFGRRIVVSTTCYRL